ncbi:rhomboid family intramembrane serine protease [Proteiniclasticum ruminis]|nr:rhomboid family intramembrane serine protease [Proteiniclasticum ruminis]
MKLIDKLDRLVSKFAVRDLMKYVMLGSFLVFLVDMTSNGLLSAFLYFNRNLILEGQVWRVLTFIFVPGSSSFFVIISFLFYFYIGRVLEMAWGTTRFNTYYFLGVLMSVIAGFFIGITTTYYLNMTLFLAYAATFPDSQVNLYFVLPIKVKFLGLLYGAFIVVEFISATMAGRIAIGVSLLNFLLFFGPGFMKVQNRRSKTQKIRRNIEVAKYTTRVQSIHKCTTCGITEKDDPNMEFRYCSKCEGNYEYCEKHIRNHEHKSKIIQMEDRRRES